MRVRLANGGTLDFVNTHLDAGRSDTDREARREQLALLERSLATAVGDGALILAGDLNLSASDPADVALRDAFTGALGLTDSGARARPESDWPILDYIFYRSGGGVTLEVLAAGEDVSFVHQGVALSDHPAIFARFRARYRVVEIPPSTGMTAPVR
jgi:endonuclease/exonuclease/phosphatase (EEP) superfamily protein YafD